VLTTVKVPKLAETTDLFVIEQWLVNVGDRVEADQSLASLETDKVTVDLPSPVAGVVRELLVQVDEETRTGDDVCTIETS
jgi:pyruvate/2-oxoglutarate dehydrogenase complex dihydrolipoamide acyltransferase (E2) component